MLRYCSTGLKVVTSGCVTEKQKDGRNLSGLLQAPALLSTKQQCWLSAGVKVLHPTQHRIRHFGDVLPSQSLAFVTNKLNRTQ